MLEHLRRGIRAMVYLGRWFRSHRTLLYYRALYSGLSVGKGVSVGRGVYISVLKGAYLRIEDGVHIDSYAYLVSHGELIIGKRTYIGLGAILVAADRIAIGEDALIAAYVTVRDQNHRWDQANKVYNEQGLVASPIEIERNVWIGTKATILRDVKIGKNSIIGANAVVSKSIPENMIAGGIPARVIKLVGQAIGDA